MAIYEEWLKVVCMPPWCGVARLGWVARLRRRRAERGRRAPSGPFSTGGAGRNSCGSARCSAGGSFPHLVVQGYAYFPVSDPDRLGFLDRINATLEITFTIATGTGAPVFP